MKARDLPAAWLGGRFEPDQWIVPCYAGLAMGHVFAVWVLMRIKFGVIEIALAEEGLLDRVFFLNWTEVARGGVVLAEDTVSSRRTRRRSTCTWTTSWSGAEPTS